MIMRYAVCKCKMFRQACLSLTPNGNWNYTTEYRADALFIFNVKISHESWLMIIDHFQDHSYTPQFSVSAVCTHNTVNTPLQMVCDVALHMNKILMKCCDYYWLYVHIFYFREKQEPSSFSSCCFRSFHINSRLNWSHFTILMILCH